MTTVVLGRGGLGDAFYSRPFVREAVRRYGQDVYVQTSWPWVFSDMPVRPVKREGGLAVQAWHGERNPAHVWAPMPRRWHRKVTLRYRWERLIKDSVVGEMEAMSKLRPPLHMDHPPLPASPLAGSEPYAVVRPPAIRCDYPAPTREPDPAYLALAAAELLALGVQVATVGWWLPGLEEPNGKVPADHRYENGELDLPSVCALVAGAAVVVCGPCWLVPFCVAARVPVVVLAGGCGGRNNPHALVDPRIDTGMVHWLLPDNYCMCRFRVHNCPKLISNFNSRVRAAFDKALVAGAAS